MQFAGCSAHHAASTQCQHSDIYAHQLSIQQMEITDAQQLSSKPESMIGVYCSPLLDDAGQKG